MISDLLLDKQFLRSAHHELDTLSPRKIFWSSINRCTPPEFRSVDSETTPSFTTDSFTSYWGIQTRSGATTHFDGDQTFISTFDSRSDSARRESCRERFHNYLFRPHPLCTMHKTCFPTRINKCALHRGILLLSRWSMRHIFIILFIQYGFLVFPPAHGFYNVVFVGLSERVWELLYSSSQQHFYWRTIRELLVPPIDDHLPVLISYHLLQRSFAVGRWWWLLKLNGHQGSRDRIFGCIIRWAYVWCRANGLGVLFRLLQESDHRGTVQGSVLRTRMSEAGSCDLSVCQRDII